MLGDLVQTLTQFGMTLTIVVIGIMLLAVCASGTSLGRALLPRAVTDVVSKLLPQSFITDATATDYNNFLLDVSGNSRLKQVNVRRCNGMTIAWTVDETQIVPQSGTFALISFRHNLNSDSTLVPEKVKKRVEIALADVLSTKQFQSADADLADLWISVFGALEDEVSLETITNSFERLDDLEWQAAVRTALSHVGVENAMKFGRGSLILDIVDSQTTEVLWRTAAIADMLVDVSDAEKERRTGVPIAEMLKKFPPRND